MMSRALVSSSKRVSHAFSAIVLTFFLGWLPTSVANAESLTVLTWADYIDMELVEEFTESTGIGVKFSYYESDDHRDEILAESDGRNYDVIVVNGAMLGTYAQRNWLAPVDAAAAPNILGVKERWRDAFPGSARYGVAYFWGTLGIGYRSDLIPEGFTKWSDFFAPSERLRGRLSMLKSARDVVGMALKAAGKSANTTDLDAIRQAGDLLLAQKPFVRSYEYVALNEESALVSGEIWATLIYSGDALMVQEHDENIVYVVPEEGSNLWADYFVVLQSSPRKDLAWRFIDFFNTPEIAARNAQFVYYATPHSEAEKLLPDDHRQDPVIYPEQSVIDRSETYSELSPRAQKTLNEVFANLLH